MRELQRLEGEVGDHVSFTNEVADQRRQDARREGGEGGAGDCVELKDGQRGKGDVAPLFVVKTERALEFFICCPFRSPCLWRRGGFPPILT